MADMTSMLVQSGVLASNVVAITGKIPDGLTALGYSAWIQSITGTTPQVVETKPGYASVYLTQAQVVKMREWLTSVATAKGGTLSIDFTPVYAPMAFRAAVTYGGAALILGYLIGKYW